MSCLAALTKFHQLYLQAFSNCLDSLPQTFPNGDSVCIVGEQVSHKPVYWQPVACEPPMHFDNIAAALELNLHPDIAAFYGHFFAGALMFDSPWGSGELLQVWNQQDLELLQQNLIGHLLMKKQLKQAPTWFIGVFDEGDSMLTVNNDDGSVWREIPGNEPCEQLALSLSEFLGVIKPRVAPPQEHHDYQDVSLEHPGIFASIKRMWHNLTGWR
ncbi:SecY-interacting protein [Shewanella cyperi]|uniref:Protein Syd n=1 Tax=Shewanella cyperi TaxID=2814292 RepID=A0A974XME1_9GAMM|nr:SecY-interacting protein [Shewanella cyperi]QSX31054.1 SecY-interacting protein [Shewanella cyperi]